MGSPKKVRVRARTRDSFRLPPSSRPQTSSTNKMAKGSGSKKAKKSGSNIFALFSQKQIQEFKGAFEIIDVDKDGIITVPDLKAAFTAIGRQLSDAEASNMTGEAPGPINFTQLVTLFAEKMAGGTDDDDVIVKSFEAFEINGQIDAEMFRHSLMTWGEKFSASEIDDAFQEFKIDGGMIDSTHLKGLMVAKNKHNILKTTNPQPNSPKDHLPEWPRDTGLEPTNFPCDNVFSTPLSKLLCIRFSAKRTNEPQACPTCLTTLLNKQSILNNVRIDQEDHFSHLLILIVNMYKPPVHECQGKARGILLPRAFLSALVSGVNVISVRVCVTGGLKQSEF